MEEVLIDTNILIYAHEETSNPKTKIAKNILLECWKGKKIFFISTQNLAEFINASKKINLKKEEAIAIVNEIMNWPYWKIISYNEKTLEKAMNNENSIFDSLILETALENNVKAIITENEKDFKTNKIKIINPF